MKIENEINIIESIDTKGWLWKVEILRAGLSQNKNYYSEEVLRKSVENKLFEGVRSFARTDNEHVNKSNESVRNTIGWFEEIKYSEEMKRIEGKFHITEDADWLRKKALSAYQSNKMDLFGFSIVASVRAESKIINGEKVTNVLEILNVHSIDPVVNPSAGGGLITLIESKITKKENNMKTRIIEMIKKDFPDYIENDKLQFMSDEELVEILNKIIYGTKNTFTEKDNKKIEVFKEEIDLINKSFEQLKLSETSNRLSEALNKSTLPEPIKVKIKKFCEGKILNQNEINNIINIEQDVYAKVVESFNKEEYKSIKLKEDEADKFQNALDNFFFMGEKLSEEERKNESKYRNGFRSIKEAYIKITGDEYISGRYDNNKRISESIDTTSFTYALANSITKKMIRDYNMMNLDTWKNFVDIVQVSDFKQQERIRIGGYGNLSSISQGSIYPNISTPTDERVTYTLSKYGGTETITLEAIRNDDVYTLRKIPTKLARAAAQTLHEHVYNWFKNNSVIYDGKQLFHNDHNNIGFAELDMTSLAEARLKMKKQTQSNSNKPIGIRAKYLLVPSDLELTAYNLTRLGYGQNNNVPTFLQEQKIIPIIVDYWQDANNWFLVADPRDAVCIELGFLDGRQEPELIISDEPNSGSLFTNDVITYKIRHIYSSAVMDYRACFGAIV